MAIKIDRIDAGSEAEALGLQPGDELLSVDENELNDTLDYDFYTDSSSFHLKAKVADGIREWDVRRAERGPFGCDFSTYLATRSIPAPTTACSASSTSCPRYARELYFKDDDERLSFLFGNYITMTNMQDHEIDRHHPRCTSRPSTSRCTPPTPAPCPDAGQQAGRRGAQVPARLVGSGIAVNCPAGALPGHQ